MHGQPTPWIHTTGSEPRRDMLLYERHSGYNTHVSLVLVHVHVVGGTDQGVAQLQQEFPPDFETPPPAVIFPG